jgi:hypothetical protein
MGPFLALALLLTSTPAVAAVFDDPVRFPGPPEANGTVDPTLAAAGATALIVSAESTTDVGAPSRLRFVRSADFGRTWSPPAPLREPEVAGRLAAVAGDGLGNWLVAFVDDTVHVSRSNDDGITWTAPADLGLAAGDERVQVAAAEPGAWLLARITSVPVPGSNATDTLVVVSRSGDGAQTWGDVVELTRARNAPMPRPDYHGPLGISLATRGGIAVLAWADVDMLGGHPSTGTVVAFRSIDGGRAWAPVTLPTLEGLAAAVARDDGKGWAIATEFGGFVPPDPGPGRSPAIQSAFSTDDGGTWLAASPLEDRIFGTARGPGLTAAGMGTWVAAWATFTTQSSELAIAHRCTGSEAWSPILRVPETLSDIQVVGHDDEILVAGRAAYPDEVVTMRGDTSAYCAGCDDGDACTLDVGDVEVGCVHTVAATSPAARQAAEAAKVHCAGEKPTRGAIKILRRAARSALRAESHPRNHRRLVRRAEARTRHAARKIAEIRDRIPAGCANDLDAAVAACMLAVECVSR